MLRTAILTVMLFGSAFFASGAQESEDFSHEFAYRGAKLEGEVFLCTSDRVASAGFRRDAIKGVVTEVADIAKQRNTTTWRITLKGSQAEVVAFTGATQTLEVAEQFSVHRGPLGLLLTWQDRKPSSQTITIDLSNSSFVYSGQDLNIWMNKTNIFVGSCRPYM